MGKSVTGAESKDVSDQVPDPGMRKRVCSFDKLRNWTRGKLVLDVCVFPPEASEMPVKPLPEAKNFECNDRGDVAVERTGRRAGSYPRPES